MNAHYLSAFEYFILPRWTAFRMIQIQRLSHTLRPDPLHTQRAAYLEN